jgi:7-cyano-7-deazaguanine synthase
METVMLHSGGLDSFVTSALLLGSGRDVKAIFFDYGQVTAGRELVAAQDCVNEVQEAYGKQAIRLRVVVLSDYKKYVEKVSIVGGSAPDSSQDGKLIFVPGRNILFLLYAAISSYDEGAREIAFSSHSSDRIAGDCRPEFIDAFQTALRWGMGVKGAQEPYKIWSPLQAMTKGDVVKAGVQRKLPLEISWSCYRAGEVHCGVCHNCVDRREGFKEAGVADPTVYEEIKSVSAS